MKEFGLPPKGQAGIGVRLEKKNQRIFTKRSQIPYYERLCFAELQ
jgi:hypothetical protein